jgi:hypothetical protein
MSAPTNDAMYVALKALYPSLSTLGDMMYQYGVDNGFNFRDTRGWDYYKDLGTDGTTLGDLAYTFWNDPDYAVSNLELEDGNDLLLEDGGFILLEAGNG